MITREFIRKVLTDCEVSFGEHQVNQIYGTALVESNNKNVRQYGGGPALGYFQMEPATRKDIFTNYLSYFPSLMKLLTRGVGQPLSCDNATFMQYPRLQVIYCWLHYRRFKAWGENVFMYAVNWKRKYNTMKGKGRSSKYVQFYNKDNENDNKR